MEIAWDQFDDVGEPVLADWGDYVVRDFVFDILAVAFVGDFTGFDAAGVALFGAQHERCLLFELLLGNFVLFILVSWFNFPFSNDIQFSAGLVHIFVPHNTGVNIDVESLARGSVISTDLV